jgi:DNA polymerase I-like protein with 3'-5' exonuclease and polymerase domains
VSPIVVDTETTIYEHGHPFSARNFLCLVGLFDNTSIPSVFDIGYTPRPILATLQDLSNKLSQFDTFVAFNAKFDLHWLRRYGILPLQHVWDLQLADFIINAQEQRMPSLNDCAERAGLGQKDDIVEREYWSQGIDTPQIPLSILVPYLEQDCRLEWALYQWQLEFLRTRPQLHNLIWRACQDLLVTEEMEWNGLKYDLELSIAEGNRILASISDIDARLCDLYPNEGINWSSGQHISAVLFGGDLKYDIREKTQRVLKDGSIKHGERWAENTTNLPRLCEPLTGTGLATAGYFTTDESHLCSLRAGGTAREIIQLLLQRKKLNKQVTTYYHGLPKLYEKMDWQDSIIHGQLNHTVARTGRLSCSAPNQQNLDEGIRQCIVTRFPRSTTSKSLSTSMVKTSS